VAATRGTGPAYTVSSKQTVIKVPGLQAVRFVMSPGESTPWHHHSQVTDYFFCLEGPMRVDLAGPAETVALACGEELAVPPGRVHRAVNPGKTSIRYLLLQGVGEYDFIASAGDVA
jgi:quercetin dioxygenase-like cupin family protein